MFQSKWKRVLTPTEHSGLKVAYIHVINIEKYVQVVGTSPSSGLSLVIRNFIAMLPRYCTTRNLELYHFRTKKNPCL